jgi:hypothetical protein
MCLPNMRLDCSRLPVSFMSIPRCASRHETSYMLVLLSMNVRVVARKAVAVLLITAIKLLTMAMQSTFVGEPFVADTALDAVLVNRR